MAAAPDTEVQPDTHFQISIAEADRFEPQSPATLTARLDYADFLLEPAAGSCAQRLDHARSLADSVDANPVARVVFPAGWARVADLRYRIDRARAACDPAAAHQTSALRAAVRAAREAVRLYRDTFDYRSMAAMQYNMALALQALGDPSGAQAALGTAIEMDREFGLRDDAQDNYALLLQWNHQRAGPEQMAQRMGDFPTRSTTLKFAWSPTNADLTLVIEHARAVDGALFLGTSTASFERRVRAADDGWVITTTRRTDPVDSGVWPQPADSERPPITFRPTLLQFPTIDLTRSGDFKSVENLASFAARMLADERSAIRAQAPAGDRATTPATDAIRGAQHEFAPDVIAAEVAQTYGLETSMWIGATLEQGVSYHLTIPLALPGVDFLIVDTRVDFLFSRELPCPNAPGARACVELILHATPMEEPLRQALADMGLAPGYTMRYASSLAMRLIVDPLTLQPYLRDTRRYWYASVGKSLPSSTLMESDHSEFTLAYRE